MPIKSVLLKLIPSVSILFSSYYAKAYETDGKLVRKMIEMQHQYMSSATFENSTFYFAQQVYSYSTASDSITVGHFLQKTDPYYYIWLWRGSERPDTMLSQYSLTTKDKELYISKYLKALAEPKTATYAVFKKMTDENEAIKNSFVENVDEKTNKNLSERKWKTDQEHFKYLYEYVQKNGWPSLKDGSEYAMNIAIKDEEHRAFYVNYLADSNSIGLSNMPGMRFLIEASSMSYDMESISYALGIKSYTSFTIHLSKEGDISGTKTMDDLKAFVKKWDDKPHKLYYIFAAPEEKDMEEWSRTTNAGGRQVMKNMQTELKKANNKIITDPETWKLTYMPCDTKELIVVLDR